jgi:nucleotide-binding universal stress UspA family protein
MKHTEKSYGTERGASQAVPARVPFVVSRILCPVDFSPASDASLRVAEGIAQSFGARIELLHVWAPPVAVALDAAFLPTAEQIAKYTEEMERALAARSATLTLPRERVDTHLIQGVAWSEIDEQARSLRCDLVVMSTHGRSGLSHLIMGSVAERVVRIARVPVLVVPAPR